MNNTSAPAKASAKLPAILLTVLLAFTMASCSKGEIPAQDANDRESATTALSNLENADTIKMDKDFISFGDHWKVQVDGTHELDIDGVDIPMFGDVYTFTSTDGGFMGMEEQEIISVSNTSYFYDMEKKKTGLLKKKIISLLAKYTLTDNQEAVVATLEQKFGMSFKGEIKDANGAVAWSFSRKALSAGSSITMTRKSDTVTAFDAIRMVAVANEVYESK